MSTMTVTRGGGGRRLLTGVLLRSEASAVLFLVILVVAAAATPGFFTLGNAENILEQIAVIGIIGLGMSQVILAGEIDISVGSGLGAAGAAAATVSTQTDANLVVTLLVAVGVGALVSVVSGLLVVVARIPSIIVTLGMMYGLRGVVNMLIPTGVTSVPSDVRALGQGTILGVNSSVVIFLICFVIAVLISRNTRWGRDIPAVGGNELAARTTGIPVRRMTFLAFVFTGVCVGIASLVYIGQLGQVQPSAGTGLELQVIAAVVVGGTALTGGRGSILSVLVGALVIATITNIANILGLAERWQSMFIGAVILIAIAADYVRQRLVERVVN